MNTRPSERGSAMLITMILVAALLAGAAVLVTLQLLASRSTEITRTGISALYCAEAGLTSTRSTIAFNQETWGDHLGTGAEPGWLSGINHDLDGDGAADFVVILEDNADEIPPTPNNPAEDSDNRIFVVSRCIKYPDMPREVRELVGYSRITNCYSSQLGGCSGNNNMNFAPP